MVVLEISENEAKVLYDILMNVGGGPTTSPRLYAGTLLDRLHLAAGGDPREFGPIPKISGKDEICYLDWPKDRNSPVVSNG